MRPSDTLLRWLAAWCGLALCGVLLRLALTPANAVVTLIHGLWWGSGGALALACLYDALRPGLLRDIAVERHLPASLALGVSSTVQLDISNPLPYALQLTIHEHLPAAVEARHLPVSLTVAARSRRTFAYPLTPIQRGDAELGGTYLRIRSRWRLWQRLRVAGKSQAIKIYPNFAPIAHYAALGLESHINQLGVHLSRRRGEGMDFHQLREFRDGDALRQIDWKATSRQRKPISREYQDERDQEIVFLLDCGRRLRAKDDALSHFDHALNALLLTAYVALRQGDAVGFMSFAGAQRWLSPIKGQTNIHTLLNRLYDVHSSTASSDFLQAAQDFMHCHRKRSLVVMISNIREEDGEDLLAATRLLSQRHVVMVASLRETFLDQTLAHDVADFNDALRYCGVARFMQQRRQLLQQLQSAGVIMVDAPPHQLHISLVNEYLRMKRSGRL